MNSFPLDLERTGYSYLERPNTALLQLFQEHVVKRTDRPRVLDVGCGAGANARTLKTMAPNVVVTGIEPNAQAAELARQTCHAVFQGTSDEWLAANPEGTFDAVIMSDVLEHVSDPVRVLRSLAAAAPLRDATWIISVPNYAVWYNRLRTLAGQFEYSWSGLYDRTHLRFFTSSSLNKLLSYVGLEVFDERATPSLVQSTAPILRKLFQRKLEAGDHLALGDAPAYKAYEKIVEPVERRVCELWPSLLGFQIVIAARRA